MGWHYILDLECEVLPEYQEFIEKEYLFTYTPSNCDIDQDNLQEQNDGETPSLHSVKLSKHYRDLINIWMNLGIGHHWHKY